MNAADLVAKLRALGVVLSVKGDRLAYDAPVGAMTPEVVEALRSNKRAILSALSPKPIGCAWREDKHGRLWFSDGTVYAPTRGGGWILAKHPTKKMQEPGTVAVAR